MQALKQKAFCSIFLVFAALVLYLTCIPTDAWADSSRRVLWRLQFGDGLTNSEKIEAEAVVLKTLSRAKERHFASTDVIKRKIETEGINIPTCFEDGSPCSKGGALLTEVHNVDAYAEAKFHKRNGLWVLNLSLYRRLGGEPTRLEMEHGALDRLVTTAIGTLFSIEASANITSQPSGVTVYLNGRLMGQTPIELKVVEGRQEFVFKKTGYEEVSWELNAKKGEVYPYEAQLQPIPSTFTMLSTATDAVVLMDGKELGPANAGYEVLPGEHEFTLKADGYHDSTQTIKVYPSHPQTAQIALLPKSEAWWDVRSRKIKRYRLSAFIGYQLMTSHMSLAKATSSIYNPGLNENVDFSPQAMDANIHTLWADPIIHSLVLAASYESEYWGAEFFRLLLGGSSMGQKEFAAQYLGKSVDLSHVMTDFLAERITHIGFYPAQFKGHYTYKFFQLEGVLGVGLSHIILHSTYNTRPYNFSQTAFSINFSTTLKCYLSEESYVGISYILQKDFEDGVDASAARRGFGISFGISPHFWLRDEKGLVEDGDGLHEIYHTLENEDTEER